MTSVSDSVRRRKLVKRIAARDGFDCKYCKKPLQFYDRECNAPNQPTLDHVIPRSRGGGNNIGNLVLACMPCNTEKDNMTAEEYWDMKWKQSQGS